MAADGGAGRLMAGSARSPKPARDEKPRAGRAKRRYRKAADPPAAAPPPQRKGSTAGQKGATGARSDPRRARRPSPAVTALPAPEPAATGRPATPVTEENLAQIETLSGLGLTEPLIAMGVLGVAERTWRDIKARDPRVSAALQLGKAKAQTTVARSLFKRAEAGEGWAVRWFEMTRGGRSAKVAAEHSGPGGRPIPHEDLSTLDAKERAQRALALLKLAAERQNGEAA